MLIDTYRLILYVSKRKKKKKKKSLNIISESQFSPMSMFEKLNYVKYFKHISIKFCQNAFHIT